MTSNWGLKKVENNINNTPAGDYTSNPSAMESTDKPSVSIFGFNAVSTDLLIGKKPEELKPANAANENEKKFYTALDSIFRSEKGTQAKAKIDKNNNGILEEDEIKEFSQSFDKNEKDISAEDLKETFKDVLNINILPPQESNETELPLTNNQTGTQEDASGMQGVSGGNFASNSAPIGDTTSSSSNNEVNSGNSSKISNSNTAVSPEDEIKELEEKRKQTIETADKNVETKNKEMSDVVEKSTKVSQKLKDEYNKINTEIKTLDSKITETEGKIKELDSSIFSIDKSIQALEGEASKLDISGKDAKVNQKNQARKSEIQKQVEAKKKEKAALEKQKVEAQKTKEKAEADKTKKEAELTKKLSEIEKADPAIKEKVEKIKTEICQIKTKKAQDIAQIDKQIEAKRQEALKKSREDGEAKASGGGAFKKALKFTLGAEGGYSNDPDDHGGATNLGITQREYTKWCQNQGLGPKDVRNITRTEAEKIYHDSYWVPSGAANTADSKLAIATFDTAVLYGVGTAKRMRESSGNNVHNLLQARLDRNAGIVARNSSQAKFLRGWNNRTNSLGNYLSGLS